jgi:plasmid maintenance system antidote protein VapI
MSTEAVANEPKVANTTGEPDEWMVAPAKARRKSAYDMPDREKIAFGLRLRNAREMAGMSLTDAAHAMGYSQPVQLSNMENGQRPVTVRVLISCANLYGTTTDYLCGLVEDVDRDPAAASVRRISSSISGAVHRLADTMVHSSIQALRKVMPTSAQGERLAQLALEAQVELGKVRARYKRFDDTVPGGNALVSRMDILGAAARDYIEHMQRSRRVMQTRITGPDGTQPQVSMLPLLDPAD